MEYPNFKNIYEMLLHTVMEYSDKPAFLERSEKSWKTTTWQEVLTQTDLFAMALLYNGWKIEDTLSILAGNDIIWPIADLGTIAAGGISVGIYPTNSPEQCAYILNHSASKFVVVDTLQQLAKVLQVQEQLNSLQGIIIKKSLSQPIESKIPVWTWEEFLKFGQAYQTKGWEDYQKIAHGRNYEDIAIIVYTSGTTGNPKGACLSHRYIITSSQSLYHFSTTVFQEIPQDLLHKHAKETFVSLSFLPYCHVAERVSGMYHRIYSGTPAYLVDDLSKLFTYLIEVSPQTFGGVPRFFEKIYATIMNDVETGHRLNKADFQKAIEINKKVKQLQHQAIPEDLQREYEWAEENVYSKVRANFGKNILVCSSGAAPIPKEVLDMFEYAGNLTILEAYGLTEFICCAFNTPKQHRANSVGKPMYGCEIKIAEDGEILLRGPQMFSGYFRDEQATKEMIREDGWLLTGDIGRLDEDGFLYITGRKKEFIKTSTGKKIAPLYIENLCKRNHLIGSVMVYGDNRKYLVAIITLNPLELMGYAQVHSIKPNSYIELTQHPNIRSFIDEAITEVNTKLSTTEQIKKYAILDHDFSVEGNEITPTGKVKRKVVAEKYMHIIESLYAGEKIG